MIVYFRRHMLWQTAIRSNAAPSLVGSEATVDPGKGGSNPGIRELSDSGEIPGKHDSARQENAFGLTSVLNMLIEYGDAFDYTGSDFAV